MDKEEYIIISKKAIQKRIEELEKEQELINEEKEPISLNINLKKQILLREVLSQSIPLTPEIEKAWLDGNTSSTRDYKEDYISNLKLDM